MLIADRPEFAQKPPPLTCSPDDMIEATAQAMSAYNYGCAVVVDGENEVIGILTERDILTRVVAVHRSPAQTRVSDVMTANPRTGRADDDVVDWLRIMSNERFRRLPILDADGKLVALFTLGDFVAYTWPELFWRPAANSAPAQASLDMRTLLLIAGSAAGYTLLMALLFNLT